MPATARCRARGRTLSEPGISANGGTGILRHSPRNDDGDIPGRGCRADRDGFYDRRRDHSPDDLSIERCGKIRSENVTILHRAISFWRSSKLELIDWPQTARLRPGSCPPDGYHFRLSMLKPLPRSPADFRGIPAFQRHPLGNGGTSFRQSVTDGWNASNSDAPVSSSTSPEAVSLKGEPVRQRPRRRAQLSSNCR